MRADEAVPGGVWPEGFEVAEGMISEEEAQHVARAHAASTWAAVRTAVGPTLHLHSVDGRPFAYAVPFALEADRFPPPSMLFARIAALHRDAGMEPEAGHWATPAMVRQLHDEFGRFGTVYVSARRSLGPILLVTNTLPAYFFLADLAAVGLRAGAAADIADARLGRLLFANPHEELVECRAGDRTMLLDADSMDFVPAEADMGASARSAPFDTPDDGTTAAWEAALADVPDTVTGDADKVVTVPNPRRIPPINWTYWCVPTAWTMGFCYWDNYTPGAGTHLGYGKVADYWFDHDPSMNNVPNLIDEIIDKSQNPPTWAGDAFQIVNAQGYNFSKSSIPCNAGNGWGWGGITAEIDAGRPVIVGMESRQGPNHNRHAMVVYGYRVTASGQRFYLLLNTWGDQWDQQSEQWATGIWQGLPMIRMSAERLVPGGGSGIDHLVLTRPGGGDTLDRLFPYDIVWYVWGAAITRSRLSVSVDGGRSWQVIAADVPTSTGKNTYRWVPTHSAARCRIRVEGFTAGGGLVAGDGSRRNVVIRTLPLNDWSGWLSLGRPGVDVTGMSAARNADGRLELVATTTDGTVWHRYQATPTSQSWIGWGSMGRPSARTWIRTAALAVNGDGRLELIALGSDGAFWHRWQPRPSQGSWATWSSVGRPPGVVLHRLAVERNSDDRLQVFGIGDDHRLWTAYQMAAGDTTWSNWASLGDAAAGVTLLHVDAHANTDGRIEVIVSGGTRTGSEFGLANPKVWLVYQPAPDAKPPWSTWIDMGHPTGGTGLPVPVLRSNADGRLEMFVAGVGGVLWHRWQPAPGQGPWRAWASLGNPAAGESLLSPLAVASSGDGRLQAFGLSIRSAAGGGLTTDCRHIWQTKPNDGWSTWGALGTPPARSVQWMDAMQRHNGRLELFALTSQDKAVWHNVQR